jgi:hypothetical protein
VERAAPDSLEVLAIIGTKVLLHPIQLSGIVAIESEDIMNGQAICKDCGNGTLNNAVNEQFVLVCDEQGNEFASCSQCGSTHIDGELSLDQDVL